MIGPPPVAGSVTVGRGPDPTWMPSSVVTSTDSPNALPETSVTSASAGLANTAEQAIADTHAADR